MKTLGKTCLNREDREAGRGFSRFRRLLSELKGFSLLELLVAVAILAITLVPIAYFYSRSVQAIENASIRSRALALAQERMNELLALPYEELRANNQPSEADLQLLKDSGIDPQTVNVYDHNSFMYHFPLPLGFNPYQPQTQGYDNSPGANRQNGNPLGDPVPGRVIAPHMNVRSMNGSPLYEYEPIGFYRALRRSSDLGTTDPRAYPIVEPPQGAGDLTRRGTETRADLFSIYGRRTIILDVVPEPADDDTDPYPVDSPLDGGANVLNPYPDLKGPANKFTVRSKYGMRGKLIIVQVFWLPAKARQGYIPPEELNMVQLRNFIPASNAAGNIEFENDLVSSNNFLFISPSGL